MDHPLDRFGLRPGADFRRRLAALGALFALAGTGSAIGPARAQAPPIAPAGPGCIARPFAADAEAPVSRRLAGVAAAERPALAPRFTADAAHLLVILAQFSDVPHRIEPARFREHLFGTGATVAGWYDDVSGGRFALTGGIHGWVTLPESQWFYSQGVGGVGAYPYNAQKMIEDAVTRAVATGLALSDYDRDADGVVDALLVIHSGQGLEWAAETRPLYANSSEPDPNSIVSHKWVAANGDLGFERRIADYITCPELQLVRPVLAPAWSDSIATIGVFCHEFGHLLGLPDFYDSLTLESRVGAWDTMDFGSWSTLPDRAPGSHPSGFGAWSRLYLGWTEPERVEAAAGDAVTRTLAVESVARGGSPVQLLANPDGLDWSPLAPGTGEYFLAEVRTREGWDASLPGEGLLLYHVDESSATNRQSDHPDSGGLVVLVPQDADWALEGGGGDPWPASQTEFGPESRPSSALFDGSSSTVVLTDFGPLTAGRMTLEASLFNLSAGTGLPFARPNPFSPARHGEVSLLFSLDALPPTGVRVALVDVAGRRIRELASGPDGGSGGRAVVWDGRDAGGNAVTSGVYFFRVTGAGPPSMGKVIVLR